MATILSIEELSERPSVSIFGKLYEMKLPEDFGVIEQGRMSRNGKKLSQMGQKMINTAEAELTEQEAQDLESSIGEFVKLILPDLPSDVLDRLSFNKRLAITQAFQQAVQEVTPSLIPQQAQG